MNTRNGSVPPAPLQDAPKLDFSAVWPALRRGWWIVLVALAVCVGLAVAYTVLRPPTYSTTSVVMVNTAVARGTDMTLEAAMMGLPERSLANEIEFLRQSVPLAESVAARLIGADSAAVAERDSAIIKRASMLLGRDRGRAQVSFDPVNNFVDMIQITAQARDPREAARMANTYAELYRERGRESSRASISNARVFLEGQVAERRGELADAEASLEAFMTREGAVNLDLEGQQVVSQTAALDAAVDNALVELQVARSSLQAIEQEAGQVFPDLATRLASGTAQQIAALQEEIARFEVQASDYYAVDPTLRGNEGRNSELAAIKRRIDEMQRQVDQLSAQYVQELRASGGIDPTVGGAGLTRIAELQNDAVAKQIEIRGLEAELTALRERQGSNEQRMRSLPTQSIQLAQLERTRQATEGMYLSLLQQLQEMRRRCRRSRWRRSRCSTSRSASCVGSSSASGSPSSATPPTTASVRPRTSRARGSPSSVRCRLSTA
jgi:tyrosine-protein kinase Etk/Wzc